MTTQHDTLAEYSADEIRNRINRQFPTATIEILTHGAYRGSVRVYIDTHLMGYWFTTVEMAGRHRFDLDALCISISSRDGAGGGLCEHD
jgi:hypothetical protein